MSAAVASSARVAARMAGFSMPASATSATRPAELVGGSAWRGAVDDRVGRAQDAEQRPAPTTVLGGAADEPRDLHQLDEHAPDARQRRDRAQGGERVVAGLDLDLGQRLEDRRLAHVRRADQRYLRRALAPDGDRVAMDGARSDARVLDLGQQRLAQVGVWPVLVVGQLRDQRPLPRESGPCPLCLPAVASPPGRTFDAASASRHLLRRSPRGRHGARSLAAAWRRASVPPLPSTLVAEGADQPFCLEIVADQASHLSGNRLLRCIISVTD